MIKLGIDILTSTKAGLIAGKRVGLLAHKASVSSNGRHTVDLLTQHLTALFGPEHGIDGTAQYMEPVEDAKCKIRNIKSEIRNSQSAIPIHSLYGRTIDFLRPTPDMLKAIDVLVVDLQDIGARYYTYIYTMSFCMEAVAKAGKKVIVCDRPNPINGLDIEGPAVEEGFKSFVGWYPLPVRHAMTIGELALYFNRTIGCDLVVIPMDGWERRFYWDDTGLTWISPSPNMRSLNAALLYPGACLIEATNVSEGRGTDTPFEIIGAPFINSNEFISTLEGLNLPQIKFAPTSFIPVADKWQAKLCNGVRLVIQERSTFRPYLTGLALIWCLYNLYLNVGNRSEGPDASMEAGSQRLVTKDQLLASIPASGPYKPASGLIASEGFKWRTEPYEFVSDIPAIDLLTGGPHVRRAIEDGASWKELALLAEPDAKWSKEREAFLLYD